MKKSIIAVTMAAVSMVSSIAYAMDCEEAKTYYLRAMVETSVYGGKCVVGGDSGSMSCILMMETGEIKDRLDSKVKEECGEKAFADDSRNPSSDYYRAYHATKIINRLYEKGV